MGLFFNKSNWFVVIDSYDHWIILNNDGQRYNVRLPVKSKVPFVSPVCAMPYEEKDFEVFVKETRQLLGIKWLARKSIIFLADDTYAIDLEKKIFALLANFCFRKSSFLGAQYDLLYNTQPPVPHICISITSRCLALTYCDMETRKTKYIDIVGLDTAQAKREILDFKNVYQSKSPAIYINNLHGTMEDFSDIGTLVSEEEMLSNAMKITRSFLISQ